MSQIKYSRKIFGGGGIFVPNTTPMQTQRPPSALPSKLGPLPFRRRMPVGALGTRARKEGHVAMSGAKRGPLVTSALAMAAGRSMARRPNSPPMPREHGAGNGRAHPRSAVDTPQQPQCVTSHQASQIRYEDFPT